MMHGFDTGFLVAAEVMEHADHAIPGDHRRDELVAGGDGRARGHGLLDRTVGQRRRLPAEAEDVLYVQAVIEREDEPGHRVEDGDGALHQLLEQFPLRPQRVQGAADVVERLQLEELSAELELVLRHRRADC